MSYNIPSAVLAAAKARPTRQLLATDSVTLDYQSVLHLALGLARIMHATTTRDRIGLVFPSSPYFTVGFLAAHLAGKVPVPLNFLLEKEELLPILKDAGLDTLITTAAFKEKLQALPLRVLFVEDLIADMQQGGPLETERFAARAANDPATILYTSGTTGVPKGVVLTHGNLLSNVEASFHDMEILPEDVFLGVLPMFHSFAMLCTVMLPLVKGCQVVYAPRFIPQTILELIQERRISVLLAVPSMYRLLVKVAQKKGLKEHPVRVAFSGGEPLSPDVREGFESVFGRPMLEGYGLTETSPVVSFNSLLHHRPGSVGRPIRDVKVRIVDEQGRPLGPEQDGEIWIQGPNVMQGYFNKPDETAKVITPDGWFRTGDIGRVSEDGFLRITGRLKDMIISSGENIFPGEIERAIAAHPAVFECAVFGIPDAKRVEAPKAVVVPHQPGTVDADGLETWLRDKLAAYKLPAEYEFRAELPHGPTGKINKKLLIAEDRAARKKN